jgi:raffinose/stachyose/melibiose transport system substrate-binding protein
VLKNIGGRWVVLALAAVTACAAVVVSGATARSHAAPPSRLSGQIRLVSHTASRVGLEALIHNFNVGYPNVKVETQYIPTGAQFGTNMLALINSNPPDVFFTNPAPGGDVPLPALAAAGKLLNLTNRPFVKRIPKQDRKIFVTNGRVYAAPLFKTASGMNVNMTEMKKRGWSVPNTFNKLLSLCGKAKAAGINLIALPGQSGQEVINAVSASTVYAADPNWDRKRLAGKVHFAGSALWTTMFRHLTAMRDADCFQPGWAAAGVADMVNFMAPGRTLIQLAPSQGISTLAAARPDVNWASYPFPGDTAAKTRGMFGYNFALSISSTTPNRQAALAFIDFAGREGQSRLIANISGSISLHDVNVGNIPPRLAAYKPLIKAGKIVGRPAAVWPTPSTVNTLNPAMAAVLTGAKSIDDVLKSVDETWGK